MAALPGPNAVKPAASTNAASSVTPRPIRSGRDAGTPLASPRVQTVPQSKLTLNEVSSVTDSPQRLSSQMQRLQNARLAATPRPRSNNAVRCNAISQHRNPGTGPASTEAAATPSAGAGQAKQVLMPLPVQINDFNAKYTPGGNSPLDAAGCSVTVAVRIRPFTLREMDNTSGNCVCALSVDASDIIVTNDAGLTTKFSYDYAFWSLDGGSANHSTKQQFASQEIVYDKLARPLLSRALEGYNACLFAYGQTGSGKSFSVMGTKGDEGIIPRFSKELFEYLQLKGCDNNRPSSNAEISFFEIYNEKIHDLLATFKGLPGENKPSLKVREHPQSGPYVEGLSSFVVRSYEDILACLDLGNKQRATAATGMNDKSSRSHSVFTIVLNQRKSTLAGDLHEHSVVSRINLVDLAGSERQSSAQTTGLRLKEGASINKSLLALGTVINLLADQAAATGKIYIPYRDSTLTWLLKDSLGGNSRTAMLATVSPSIAHIEETLSTLRYASRARSIVNVARINEDPSARLIRELRAEINRLRQTSSDGQGENSLCDDYTTLAEITELKKALQEKERELADMQRTWEEKLLSMGAANHIREETALLENTGVTLKADDRLPSLVNLNEDPQLSEVLLYVVKPGLSRVGRRRPGSKADIQLAGALVADEHCLLKSNGGVVMLEPIEDAQCYVNGVLIAGEQALHHGDRVVIGGNHYFRFNYPAHVTKHKGDGVDLARDFAYAQGELLRVQNERMLAERERLKADLQRDMSSALAANQSEYCSRLDQQRLQYEGTIRQLEKDLEMRIQADKAAQEEKLTIEKEVLANRKRMRVQTDQSEEEARRIRENLVRQLAAEKERAEASLRRIAESREASRLRSAATCSTEALSSSCRTSLLIREANQMCTHLGKSLTFQVEDLLPPTVCNSQQMQTVVAVTNRKLAAVTFWSLDKFEARVAELREAFGSAGDSGTSEFDVILDSACDRWEPLSSLKSMKQDDKRKVMNHIIGCEADESEADVAALSPSPREPKKTNNDLQNCQATAAVCEDILRFTMRKYKGQTRAVTVLDQLLVQSQAVVTATRTLLQNCKVSASPAEPGVASTAVSNATPPVMPDSTTASSCVQLVAAVEALLSQSQLCNALSNSGENDGADCSAIATESAVQDCIAELQGTIAKVSTNAVLLLQGIKSSSSVMVRTAAADIFEAAVLTSSGIGRLSSMTGTKLDSSDAAQLCTKLSAAVTRGVIDHMARSIDSTLISVRGSLCSLRTVRQARAKDQVPNPCEQLLQLLGDLLQSLRTRLLVNCGGSQELAGKTSGGTKSGTPAAPCDTMIWSEMDVASCEEAAILDCWQKQGHYCVWVQCVVHIKASLGLLVKPLLRSGSEQGEDCTARGALAIRQALQALFNDLPASDPSTAALQDLFQQINQQISALASESKTSPSMSRTSSASRLLTAPLAGAKRRASFATPLSVSKLAAVFEK